MKIQKNGAHFLQKCAIFTIGINIRNIFDLGI